MKDRTQLNKISIKTFLFNNISNNNKIIKILKLTMETKIKMQEKEIKKINQSKRKKDRRKT